jgi:hypothetical protein
MEEKIRQKSLTTAPRPIPKLSPLAKSFRPGIYRHFKGDLYEAMFVARNSEARDEEFVVYRSLAKGQVWIRPLKMFFNKVKKKEYQGPRFAWVRKKK